MTKHKFQPGDIIQAKSDVKVATETRDFDLIVMSKGDYAMILEYGNSLVAYSLCYYSSPLPAHMVSMAGDADEYMDDLVQNWYFSYAVLLYRGTKFFYWRAPTVETEDEAEIILEFSMNQVFDRPKENDLIN